MKLLQNLIRSRLAVMLTLLAMSLPAMAQINVTGTVVDASNEPVIGATVMVKGTTQGTITDINGAFNLSVPSANSIIAINYVGCVPVEFKADSPMLSKPIVLKEDSELLDEVIVIGYGKVKKMDATGSLTAIRPDDANRGAAVTPQDALIGKVAGVNVVSDGGQPGQNATMRIRSGSSLSASNDPLVVVDGVPLADIALSDINPNDIETFTVLKDASATAIYGSRASNGVIVITTKRGHKSLKISYQGNATVSTTTKRTEVLNPDEYRAIFHTIPGAPANLQLGDANTDWQDEIYRTAFGTDHNIAVSGDLAKIKTPFRFSLGYTNQDGVIKTNNYQRVTGAVSLNPVLFDNHLSINLNANVTYSRDKDVDKGVVRTALFFDPTRPVRTNSSTPDTDPGRGYFIWTNGGAPMAIQTENPVAQLELDDRLTRRTRSIGSAQLQYKIHGLEDLKANVNLGYDYTHYLTTRDVADLSCMTYTDFMKDGRGANLRTTRDKRNYLLDAYLNYEHTWAKKHRFEAMAGYGWQHFWKNKEYLQHTTDGKEIKQRAYDESEHYLLSYYGRVNYDYDSRYLITATLRADASSRFAKENRWGYFPSVALGWRVIGEEFMKGQDIMSDLKLRASYGVTGQQEIDSDYPWMTTFTVSANEADYLFGDEWYHTYRPNGYDRDIKWETTRTWNFGADYGFLNNRIYGSVDYYIRNTKDLLNNINVPSGVNYAPVIYTNIGSMRNTGVELSVNAVPVKTRDWTWSVGLNYTWQKSKITKLNVVDSEDTYVETGTLDSRKFTQVFMVGQAPYTYYLAKQVYDENGKPVEGQYYQPDGTIGSTETRQLSNHSALPHSLLGFNTRLTYKNWELSVAGHGMFGNYVFNYVAADQALTGAYSDQGYCNNLLRSSITAGFNERQLTSDYYLENGSFFKFDNVTLGYTFTKLWNTQSSLRLTFAINNLATITNYSGVDPEVYSGVDKNVYPRPRTYSIGVNLTF